jgi:hypothetical protein
MNSTAKDAENRQENTLFCLWPLAFLAVQFVTCSWVIICVYLRSSAVKQKLIERATDYEYRRT